MRYAATVLLAAFVAAPAFAAPPKGFDARVEQVMRASGTPGMAVAIVEDGKVTLVKGYGVRRQGAPERVDANTAFLIGSTAKAMTAAAIATLVDAGTLGWDDRVVDHLPGFQMYDAWVTREMTVRDLLVHRSGLGLGAGDLLYVPRGSYSRAEIVRRLRYIAPATSFRSGYAYDNVLYTVAGQLIEAVSGQRWARPGSWRPSGQCATAPCRTRASAARCAAPVRCAGSTSATSFPRPPPPPV
jgi:CubicO group peptidase (beta-lactamase class C family)